jgi:hypothetical protein
MVLPPKVIHPKGDTEISLKKREISAALLNKSKFGQSYPFLTLVKLLRTQACPDLSFC